LKPRKEFIAMKPNARTVGIVLLAGFVVAGVALLGACKGAREKGGQQLAEKMVENALEKQTGKKAKVDLDKGKVKIETAEGSTEISQSAEWPGDLPPEVPAFKLGAIKGVWKSEAQGQKSWTIVLENIKPDAMAKYSEELKAAGWKILSTFSLAEGSGTFSAGRDGGLNLTATFNGPDKSGGLSILLKPAEQQD
jgi:hypothetical protein